MYVYINYKETKVNQWKNTNTVIAWFKSLLYKSCLSFANFDIESFYPSISSNLFQQAKDFAREKVEITDTDISIIMQARKTLLFPEGVPWVKQSDNEDFDVPMTSYDGAEVCELVGAFLLNNLSHIIDKSNVGLYRDDGLGVFKSHAGPETERKRKEIIKAFNTYTLPITIETNIRIVNIFDTTFDLINDLYRPYRKPNDTPVYINKNSKHPPTVLRQLAKSVSKRISETSSNEQIFKESIPIYEEALKRVDFTKNLNMSEKK